MNRFAFGAMFLVVACSAHRGETLRGTELGDVVEAPGDGARTYSTRESSHAILADHHADAIQRGIERAANVSHTTLAGDGRLGLLAGYLAERIGNGATLPPSELTRFFAWHLGMPETTPHALLVGVADETAIEAAVADSVGQYLRRQRYDAYGATLIERQGIDLVVVTLSPRPFELDDLPRSISDPRAMTVSGSVAEGFEEPTFEVTGPDGAATRIPAGRGPSFEASLPLTRDGEYEIRLVATGTSGATMLARFPVYVGEDPPDSVRLGGSETARASTASVESTAADLFRLLNEARAGQGLPPLDSHEGLVTLARAHSTDMIDHGFFAHQSPTTGSPTDRVRTANLSTGLVLENIGRGNDAQAIQNSLMSSPQHRANILNRDVTHVGIGVVERGSGHRREFVVTEVFFRIARSIDTATAPSTLLAAINRARAARNARAAEIDENLSRAAAQAARQYLEDPNATDADVLDAATGSLRRFAIAYRRVGGVLAVVSSLDEAATLEPTFDPAVGNLGIGVAQGTRPGIAPNSIVVVYILAWDR